MYCYNESPNTNMKRDLEPCQKCQSADFYVRHKIKINLKIRMDNKSGYQGPQRLREMVPSHKIRL